MKTLNRTKILVTGGAGFIGSHTVSELWNVGYEPIILDNFSNSDTSVIDRLKTLTSQRLVCYNVDCTNEAHVSKVVEQEGTIKGIIHFAAFKSVSESINDPEKYMHNNMESLRVMLNVKERYDIPNFVFSSSATVYGQPKSLPANETAERQNAESPYGLTKQLGEDMIIERLETGGSILRYFNPIGAHPSGLIGELPNGVPSNLVPFVTQTAAGIRQELNVFGTDYDTEDGTAVRDFIHVVDLARAHVSALLRLSHTRKTDVFNIGTGKGASVQGLIDAFEQETGVQVPVNYAERRAGDVAEIYADCQKANELLHWEARYSLRDALRHAWRWEKRISQLAKVA